jgi:Protein of unknown function (DUF2934)
MSLIHYVKPFLELGICKEYSMPRKTTGTTTTRSKKTLTSTPPAIAQTASEVSVPMPKAGKLGQTASVAPPVNLEEAIRRRAYELYLERRATAGGATGNENQDWLIAEQEILSRHHGPNHHTM